MNTNGEEIKEKEVLVPEFEMVQNVKEADIKRMMSGLWTIISSDDPFKALQELINNEDLLKEVKERRFGREDKNNIPEPKRKEQKTPDQLRAEFKLICASLNGKLNELYSDVTAIQRKLDIMQDDFLKASINFHNKYPVQQ